jgi:PAS domain S-box-containing protein
MLPLASRRVEGAAPLPAKSDIVNDAAPPDPRAIIDSATDSAIVALDADGRILTWSRGAQALFGWAADEVLGRDIGLLFTEEDRAAGVPAQERALAAEHGRAVEERWMQRKDGSRFFGHGAMTPLAGGGGGFVKALRDITDQHGARDELIASREKLELATRAARLGQYDYWPLLDRLEWDDRCRALFGLSPGVPVSYEGVFLAGLHPDDRDRVAAAVAGSLDPAGSRTYDAEYRTIGIEDGVERWVHAQGITFFDGDSPLRLIGTVQDVTLERERQAALRETEERLRLAVRATNDAIWDWDLVRDHVLWNEAIERGYGHKLAEVGRTGAWWIGNIHPDDRVYVDKSIHAVIDGTGTDWTDEYRFRRADGSWADVRDRGYVLRDAEGRAVRMIGAMLDQSDRKREERRLREEASGLAVEVRRGQQEIARLWTSSPDLMVQVGPDLTYRRVNPAWRAILGWEPHELTGRPAGMLLHPDDRPPHDTVLADAQVAPVSHHENRMRHKDGSYRWISWSSAPSEGEIFAIGRDVTEVRAAQEALRQTEEALRQSQKVEAVGQLTGGVAHDFNNLLTVIRGSVDLLRRPGLSEEKRVRYVEAIADTADRASRLTSQLLAFARRSALQPQVFDAAAAIDAMDAMLRTLTGPRVEIRYHLADAPAWVNTDPSQFDTAIVNMAVNARDAMTGEGVLTIAVRRADTLPPIRAHAAVPGRFVAVSITDTGSGIAADKIEHIFEPFFTTKGVGHGTGLGLSQVFGFAKQSHGEIVAESEPGRGATFTLFLPEAQPTASGDETAPAPRAIRAGARVLVVEDNRDVGEFATSALAELGYGSHWSPNADAALRELARAAADYDVVFTDVVMPGKSGIELGEEVRRLYPGLPVVLTSGFSDVLADQGTRGFRLLHKPYSIDELARALEGATA